MQTAFPLPTQSPAPVPGSPLTEFAKYIPLQQLQELKMKHLKDDTKFQAAVVYFKSPEWKKIAEDVKKNQAWTQYKSFMKQNGVDLDYAIQHLEHCLNATDTTNFKIKGVKPSIGDFYNDIKTTYGILIMKAAQAYLEKEGDSDNYKNFVARLQSEDARMLLEKALEQPAIKKFALKLKELDFDLDYLIELVYTIFAWRPFVTITP